MGYGGGVRRVKEFHLSVFGEDPVLVASVPGRLDFLNTHQDYKGLPVVSIGVDRRMFFALSPGGEGLFRAASYNLKYSGREYYDSFRLGEGLKGGGWFGDYLRASIKALTWRGLEPGPVSVSIYSEIPVGAGMASSGALTSGYIYSVLRASGLRLGLGEVAELAFKAEHDIMGVPCGRLDQYGCVYGGVSLINNRPPYGARKLGIPGGSFLAADSGIRHRTAEIHPRRQEELDEGLRELLELDLPEDVKSLVKPSHRVVEWERLGGVIEPYLESIDEIPRKRILFTLRMHESTIEAVRILEGGRASGGYIRSILGTVEEWLGFRVTAPSTALEELGLILTYQHVLLSTLYDVSLRRLDEMVRSSIEAGALGAKLSGAGMGGIILAYARDEATAKRLAENLKGEGLASDSWVLRVDEGALTHLFKPPPY